MDVKPETQFDLLRHGEPVGGSRYRGQRDDELSARGWEQMWTAVGEARHWQQIVTSPLRRCSAFAWSLGDKLGVPVREEDRFREIGFGVWEGKTRAELERIMPGQIARFYADPVNNRPGGAEPLAEFTARVQNGLHEMLDSFTGQSILVVAHAGVIRAILAHALGMTEATMYRINVSNAGISRLRTSSERGFSLIAHGGR